MSNESNLQVTFSKRRSGLFKKASELCILCGAEIVIIVFSPGKKVFSFGHPNVESIIDRFLSRNTNPTGRNSTDVAIMAHRDATVSMQLTRVQNELEAEKKLNVELTRMRKARQAQCWWEAPIEELNLSQLKQLKCAFEDLKKNVVKQADRLMVESSNPQYFPAGNFNSRIHDYSNYNDNKSNVMFNPNSIPLGFNLGYGSSGGGNFF
ncbi:hypothetical protein ACFE04_009163 [Oxalis oulophora]